MDTEKSGNNKGLGGIHLGEVEQKGGIMFSMVVYLSSWFKKSNINIGQIARLFILLRRGERSPHTHSSFPPLGGPRLVKGYSFERSTLIFEIRYFKFL